MKVKLKLKQFYKECVEIVERGNEDETMGAIIRLGKEIKDEDSTEAMLKLSLITALLEEAEDEG